MNTEIYCVPGLDSYEFVNTTLSSPDAWFVDAAGGATADSGVRVNGYTALTNCCVWQAVNVLAGDVGQLPIKLYRKEGRNREEVDGEPAIELLRERPNPWQTPSVWKETMMSWALIWGNALSWIRTDTGGKPTMMVPLRPDRVGFEFDDELTGRFHYTYRTIKGATITFDASEIYHIQGLAGDGVWGYSLVEVAKNCIGHGLALEKHGNKSFANGARPSGVLKHPGKMAPEARANLRAEWNQLHAGSDNAGRVAVLWEGMEFAAMQMSNEDSQWLQARRLDREFVASLFNLPAFKLNSLEHSSVRANLEEQNRDYFQTSLSRWLNRFAEQARSKLLSEKQRTTGHYYRWLPEAFLKGDIQKRYQAYGVAITNRVLNPNEVREKEDMNPYDGGDEYSNPNIDVTPKADESADKAAESLVQDRLRQCVTAEVNAVSRAASSVKNFVQWIDKYYEGGGGYWSLVEKSLQPVVNAVSAMRSTFSFDVAAFAQQHANESKRRLLKVCDQTVSDRLIESIKAECQTWEARIKQCA